MTIRKIIRIEERNGFNQERMLKLFGDKQVVIFTNLQTQSSGIMTNSDLNKYYYKMVGKSRGKDCYMERLK